MSRFSAVCAQHLGLHLSSLMLSFLCSCSVPGFRQTILFPKSASSSLNKQEQRNHTQPSGGATSSRVQCEWGTQLVTVPGLFRNTLLLSNVKIASALQFSFHQSETHHNTLQALANCCFLDMLLLFVQTSLLHLLSFRHILMLWQPEKPLLCAQRAM